MSWRLKPIGLERQQRGAGTGPCSCAGASATSSGVPSHDERAAAAAALGAEVDDPVGGLDDVEVVLDHQHGVALVDEAATAR